MINLVVEADNIDEALGLAIRKCNESLGRGFDLRYRMSVDTATDLSDQLERLSEACDSIA